MTFRELLVTLQGFVRHNPEHQALDEHVVVRLQTNDEHGDELHAGSLRIATVDAGCTETFALVLDADQDPDEPDDEEREVELVLNKENLFVKAALSP